MTEAPREYDSFAPPGRFSKGRFKIRLRGLVVATICWGAIACAASLAPRQAGYGTHTQMGLPGCGFLARTGYPCPGCGMTTSIAAMAHGQVLKAAGAQLFGAMLFLAAVTFGLLGLIDAVTGANLLGKARPRPWWAWVALAGLLLGWGVKVALGVLSGQYPLWS